MSLPPGDGSPNSESTAQQAAAANRNDLNPKQLPKGVVLDKDGKPCRSCTSFASWAAMTKAQNPNKPSSAVAAFPGQTTSMAGQEQALTLPPDCPPDVEALGRSTWTFLHTLTATYPPRPTAAQQQQTRTFMSLFSNMYPCGHCAEELQEWMGREGNGPRTSSRDEFGRWMCEAHNAVNERLGKERFDCGKWEERWRTGPEDGRCG